MRAAREPVDQIRPDNVMAERLIRRFNSAVLAGEGSVFSMGEGCQDSVLDEVNARLGNSDSGYIAKIEIERQYSPPKCDFDANHYPGMDWMKDRPVVVFYPLPERTRSSSTEAVQNGKNEVESTIV